MFKRAIIIAISIFMLFVNTMAVAGTFEVQSTRVGDKLPWKQSMTMICGERISPQWGWFGAMKATTGGWCEGYVGPTFTEGKTTVSACVGLESTKQKSRFAAWGSTKYGHFSLAMNWEDGASGPLYKHLLKYNTDTGNIVLWSQRRLGNGFRVEINAPKKYRALAYFGLMFKEGDTTPVVGVIKTF